MKFQTFFIASLLFGISSSCQTKNAADGFIYWQALSNDEKKLTIESGEVCNLAANYFKGNFKLTENSSYNALLNCITSYDKPNQNLVAFYFFLFNKICQEGDGAISESLGNYCQVMMLRNPSYVFNYFLSDRTVMTKYARYLGSELFFKAEGTSTMKYGYADFKKMIMKDIGKDKRYTDIVSSFFVEVEKVMESMD